ncbi:hypothetical protein MUK42_28897 [Musa troglodytarum]|uniref:Uncharacterized protein n=1 Tax=Musa troglodytarum TaxID=320322 RepID=A0A9E7FKN2_9LILI|nr:hypothetical protein MUK42_28897 [Musa troglodytarum]URD96817.1 hypothetical protein MUK42_28897 [Musa troglodytarum]URD96818.1 hypothetical protein MUK42_28897 [Musa troglodytarum]
MVTAMAVACPPPLSLGFARQVRTKIHCRRHRHALRAARRESGTRTLFLSCPPPCGRRVVNYRSASHAEEIPAPVPASTEDESSFSVLTAITSPHNDIVVVDTPASRFLLLDSTHNIHSMLNKERLLTGSYWDDFASLPAIVPEGPIAILGLGGGTAAHIMLKLWPNLHLEGWEIDEILIDMAREYFGLSELEKCTSAGGSLSVHIGDAFSESVRVPGGFAGIIVDLFSDGKILPQLKEVTTWLDIERKLMPQGRIMVNCGGAHAEVSGSGDRTANMNSSWIQNSTIKALCQAFPGKLSWKRIAEKDSDNYLALTGPLPDLDAWSAAVPHQLSMNAKDWRTCEVAS